MKNIIKISTPLDIKKIINLKAGDFVNITGNIYAARDAAHKRFSELIKKGKNLLNQGILAALSVLLPVIEWTPTLRNYWKEVLRG